MDYDEYLKSPHWQRMATLARERAGNRCQVCNADVLMEVHHRTYERMGHEQLEDLTALCPRCHALYHEAMPKLLRRTMTLEQYLSYLEQLAQVGPPLSQAELDAEWARAREIVFCLGRPDMVAMNMFWCKTRLNEAVVPGAEIGGDDA